MNMSLTEKLQCLLKSTSVEEEKDALKQIHQCLTKTTHSRTDNEETDTKKFNTSSQINGYVSCNPYAGIELSTVLQNSQTLNKFVCYIFERRYGWSEAGKDGGRRVRKISSTGATLDSSNGQLKAAINDFLDNLIKWISSQEISPELLDAFSYTVKEVPEMPVVRNRTVIQVMEWFKENKSTLRDTKSFPAILNLISMSLCDVWSAIRSSCAKQLGQIYLFLSNKDQESLFAALAQYCTNDASSWQAKEGAIMGISSILHQYKDDSHSKPPVFTISALSQEGDKSTVPEFISQHVHFVVFKLLSDPQLTVREHAAKALSTYISCSSINEASSTFNKVMEQLQRGVKHSIMEKRDHGDGKVNPEGLKSIRLPIQYLEAYAAEGLLNVCQSLVKSLPLRELLPSWPQHIHAFLLYLSHPASTVRQAASSIFKGLVQKCCHFGVLVKLVMQSLVDGWETDIEHLQSYEDHAYESSLKESLPSVCDNSVYSLCDTWESREGRLFAYELIMKFLIKNHWLYTFGPAGINLLQRENSGNAECMNEDERPPENSQDNTQQRRQKRFHSISESDESGGKYNIITKNDAKVPESEGLSIHIKRMQFRKLHFKSQGSIVVNMVSEANLPNSQKSSPFNTTFSLLMQIQHLDSEHEKENDPSLQNSSELKTGLMQALTDKRISMNESWMKKVKLTEFRSILCSVLYQTIECLADPRWELRRMAQQVLPCLAEVIRWYDVDILDEFWKKHLSHQKCPLTYGSVLLLKESVTHSVRLQKLLLKPPTTWQNPELCKSLIIRITNAMKYHVPVLLPYLDKIIQRPTYDKLSVISATTIIISHTHYSIQSEQRVSQIATVLSFWKLLFCFTHSNTRICRELLINGADLKLFSSPFEGYLSCCLVKPDNKLQCAKQVEKCFIGEVHHEIKNFLQSLPVESICSLLPILAHYTGLLLEDTHMCKALSDCLSCVGSRVVEHTQGVRSEEQRHLCLKCLHLTLKELAAIVTLKSSDVHLIQKVLNCYLVLCKPINPVKHLRHILVAICSRISEGIYFSVEHSPRPDDDLSLLSNDIPMSNSTESLHDLDPDDAVVIGSPSTFPECLTLNLSNNSLPSGRLSSHSQHSDKGAPKSASPSEEGDSSDWDSWDEDQDETQSALNSAFGEFLQKLRKLCDNASRDVFGLEMKKLDTKERSLIREMLD